MAGAERHAEQGIFGDRNGQAGQDRALGPVAADIDHHRAGRLGTGRPSLIAAAIGSLDQPHLAGASTLGRLLGGAALDRGRAWRHTDLVAGRAAQHRLGFFTDRQNLALAALRCERGDGRFVEDDPPPLHIDQRTGCPEVDPHVRRSLKVNLGRPPLRSA